MADDPTPASSRRRTFGPVVLVGLVAAGLASVAGTKPWVEGRSGNLDSSAEDGSTMSSVLNLDGASTAPLAGALALAVLACWGVLLVARGRFRRAVAVLALVTAVGLLAATVEALFSLRSKLADSLMEVSGSDTATTGLTSWYAAGAVAAVLCVAATTAAVVLTPSWPEMGTRYDAPTGDVEAGSDEVPTDNIDIWKALDEGRDPTA